jgi:signal transduction histidine kinase
LISTQIQRISQVTRDMMDFARVRPSAKNPVNINEILEVSLRLASFDKTFQKLRLKKIFDDDLPEVYADSDQMQQVFLNLLLNARDAMPDGGAISIKTFKQENEIIIELEDSGIGIGNNDRKKNL